MQSTASVVQGLVKNLGNSIITERSKKPRKKHCALHCNSETSTEAAEDKFSHNNSFQMGTNNESEAFKESACCDGCSKHGIYCLHTNLCEPYHCGSQCILGLLPSLYFVSSAAIFGIGSASLFAQSMFLVPCGTNTVQPHTTYVHMV